MAMNGEELKVIRQELKEVKDEIKGHIDFRFQESEKLCFEKHEPIKEHLKSAPEHRDKITSLSVRQNIIWAILFIITTSTIGLALKILFE